MGLDNHMITDRRARLPSTVDRAVTVAQPGAVVSPPPKGTVWGRIAYATTIGDSIDECARTLDAAGAALRVQPSSRVDGRRYDDEH